MAISRQIAAGADDCYRFWGDRDFLGYSEWWDNDSVVSAGWYRSSLDMELSKECALRFLNITIDQSAEVPTSTIKVKHSSGGYTEVVDLDIQAFDEDNSSQVASFADFGNRARTTASVRWQTTFEPDNEYESPDIKSVIQEIVNRGGWSSGNAIQIVIGDHTYKYPNYPAPNSYEFHTLYGVSYDDGYNSTLTIGVLCTDIGIRVRKSAETIKIGVHTLEATDKLRIRKGDTTYGIPLLATDDPDASPVRVYDGSAIKSLPKVD